MRKSFVIVGVLAIYLFGFVTSSIASSFDSATKSDPEVVVSWGTNNEDEDDLVVTVDGVERWREHGDYLNGYETVEVPKDQYDDYVSLYAKLRVERDEQE